MVGNRFEIPSTEWRWAMVWSLTLLALSCLPYLVAANAAPPGWQFAGILVNPLDGHSYLAKMQQGAAGDWLFQLTYTPEPHAGVFIFTFYLALGHLSSWTGLSKIWVFHLARLAAGLFLLLVAYRFIAQVTPRRTERYLAFALTLTASGWGWLGVILGAFPIDLWVPEAFVPYSIYTNPHFPLGLGLMLLVFSQFVRSNRSYLSRGAILAAGLTALLLALLLPFALLTAWAVLGLFLVWQSLARAGRLPWREIWLTLTTVLAALPVMAYQYWISATHPVLAGWAAQNITSAPPLSDVAWGYGLLGLLALAGLAWLLGPGRADLSEGERLIVTWAVATLALLYVPFALQRRLLSGLHLPLCLLAAIGLWRWLKLTPLMPGYRWLTIIGVVTFGTLGTLFVWALPVISALQSPNGSPTAALLFIREEEATAFTWLRSHVEPDAVVLASPRVGMFLPGETGARSFYGHPFETINAANKKSQLEAFFAGALVQTSPPSDLVFYGPSERALGQPAELANLTLIYDADDVKIYQFKR